MPVTNLGAVRILQVPHAYAPVRGGAEHYAARVGESLAKLGHEVHVFTADFSSPEGFYQLGIDPVPEPDEIRNGVSVTRYCLTTRPYRLAGRLAPHLPPSAQRVLETQVLNANRRRFTSGLIEKVEAFRPDVVIALPHLFTNVRAVLDVRRRLAFPLILVPMLHEEDPFWSIDDVAQALAQANAVIALTPHEARRIATAYGVPESSIFACSGGVDLPSEPGSQDRSELVLYLGRKVFAKGLEDLIAAMRLVWIDHPSARLVLAGTRTAATDQVDHLIENLAPEERSRVSSLDDVSDDVKRALLSEARCLVLPSQIESLGLVVLEAWAHGTAVVTLDVPVFRDLVETGRDGFLVAPGDPTEMALAIQTLLGDGEMARAMGREGRKKAEQMTWNDVASCMMHAIRLATRSMNSS